MSLLEQSIAELSKGLRAKQFSAVELAKAYIERMEQAEPHIHAYLRQTPELAIEQAQHVDRKLSSGNEIGPLGGIPMALKDIFATEGIETTAGSRILQGWKPSYDGSQATRLRQAGAVLLGKVTMDEFAMGSSNENTPFTKPRNPWATEYVPGGSSGGSAAAVAARMAAFTLGTDTGGSIRQPASLCNLVGFKPTYGRVSRYGMIAFASSLDQAGPMTRTVRDSAAVLQAIAGHDLHDATSLDVPVPDYLAACERGVRGLRVGVQRAAMELPGLDPEVRGAFQASLEVLRGLGAELVDIELPHFRYAVATYYVLATAEASSNLARYDGVRYGLRVPGETLLDTYKATREQGFGPEVKRRILLGTFVLRKGSYDAYYGRAQRIRTLLSRDYEHAFRKCDVIASPTSPLPGFRLGAYANDPLSLYLADVFTIGVNLAGLPAVSIPGGFTQATAARPSLPIGLQLCGPRLGEEVLFAAAAAHESATVWHQAIPPL